jgi:hypothetical protein
MMKGAKETSLAGGYPVATQPPYSFDVTGQVRVALSSFPPYKYPLTKR